MFEQRLEEESTVVDLLIDGVVRREASLTCGHPSRKAIILILAQMNGQHASLKIDRKPVGDVDHLKMTAKSMLRPMGRRQFDILKACVIKFTNYCLSNFLFISFNFHFDAIFQHQQQILQ